MTAPIKKILPRSTSDKVGLISSGLCLIHCIAAPLFLALPFVNLHLPDDFAHHLLAPIVLLFMGGTLFRGMRQTDFQWARVGLPLLSGGLLILGSLFIEWPFGHTLTTVCGSLLLLLGHRNNLSCCEACHHHPALGEEENNSNVGTRTEITLRLTER